MRCFLKIIICVLLCLVVRASYAVMPYQPVEGNVFNESWRWTEFDFLSPYVVRQASKAPDGTLWFAVHGGVVAYDGYVVTPYMFADAGLEESNTISIFAASDGIVYAETKDFAACLENGKWTLLFETAFEGSIPYSSGSRIAESRDSSVWFALAGGLFRVADKIPKKIDLASNSFSAVLIDSSDRIWLAERTQREILRYEINTENGLPEGNPYRLATRGVEGSEFIVEFTMGASGYVYIVANSNVDALRRVSGDHTELLLKDWTSFGRTNHYLLERPDGSIWVTTQALIAEYKEGIWTFHDMQGQATWFSFMYPYDQNTLILGGHTDKTYLFDVSTDKWKSYEGLNFNCRDQQGRDWFINQSKQIVYNDTIEEAWFVFDEGDNVIDQPNRIICTEDGYLFATGSHQGSAAVAWFINGIWDFNRHDVFAETISYNSPHLGNDGILYLGADVINPDNRSRKGGLLKYWVEDGRVEYVYEFPPDVPTSIRQIAQTPDQRLWLSSSSSLWMKEGNLRATIFDDNYRGEWIDDMAVDSDGYLWVLAWKSGLARLINGKWERFDLPGQDRTNKTAALHAGEDDESVWVALNNGLNRFDGNSWFEFVYLPELNLLRQQCLILESPDESLWINLATPNWYGNNQPEEIYKTEIFRTVQYSGDRQPPDTQILNHDKTIIESSNLLIQWTGKDAWASTRSSNLHYSHRINHGEWSEFQIDPEVLLQSVEPGHYTIEVRARDLDWNVDPTPAVWTYTVKPFFWKQPWFITAVLIVLATIVSLIVYIVRLRVRHLIAMEEFKIDFFTNISHELRTPLSAIIGPLESMLKKPSAEPFKGSLDMVYRNAKRMLGLVNQLLEFRKVELGMLKYEPVRSDLMLFLKDVIYAHAVLWEKKNQEFRLTTSHGHRLCCFDPEKLQHIATNLISNAIKYTPEDGKIEVSVKVSGKPFFMSDSEDSAKINREVDEWLYLEVSDTGIGIRRDQQELIFKPFYREKDYGRNHEGTGIGLAYTHELVNLWGGFIQIESPIENLDGVSCGTRFRVCLPLIECEETNELISSYLDEPVQPVMESETDSEEEPENNSVLSTVLIVDDNADIREFLQSELSELYKIVNAENGQEGIAAAKEFHPDLILADLMMPVMDGLQMCSALKTDPETSHIPILMLTARRSDSFRIKGIEHGADDYYAKPVNIDLLKVRIKSLMDSRRLLRERFTRQVLIQPEEITVTPIDEQFLRKAVKIVEDHMRDEDFDVEAFSREMGMGRASLYRKMNAIVGEPPFKFIRSIRLKRAAQLLESGNFNVSETMEQIGINGLSHFGKIFRDEYGFSPSEFRARFVDNEPMTGKPAPKN